MIRAAPTRSFSLPGVFENQLLSLVSDVFRQYSCGNVVDDEGVTITNFFIAGRLRKTSLASILGHIGSRVSIFLDVLGSRAPRWLPARA